MAFTPKNWIDEPNAFDVLEGSTSPVSTTPLDAAAMEDLEVRLTNYTDDQALPFRSLQTFTVTGAVAVASGDTDFVPPFFVSIASGRTVNLVKARYKIRAGTSATCKLQKNGVDISGFTSLSATTTATTTTGSVSLAEDDSIALVVTAVDTSPFNLSFTVVLEHGLA